MKANLAIIAAAGSGKTQDIIDRALVDRSRRVLITTYTTDNLDQIRRRLAVAAGGVVPSNITTMSWFSFLLNHGARPYQRAVLDDVPNVVKSLNFRATHSRFTRRADSYRYFLDSRGDMYSEGLAHFVCEAERLTGGRVSARLAQVYDDVFVDEVQDLVGWDLEVLDMLLDARLTTTIVGDPRQHTYSTNRSSKNKKYRGAGLVDWFEERVDRCDLEERNYSSRCNQAICDLADGLFPKLPATISTNSKVTGHDGIFEISRSEVAEYVARYGPVILRNNRTVDTLGYPAVNFGAAKGATYDRVLIFPTKPILKYLKSRLPDDAGSKDRLYVAITRARFSVAFVVG